MTCDEVFELALNLPETEETVYYGSPAVKRGGRAMFAAGKSGETVSIKLDWDTLDKAVLEKPEICYQTPHQQPAPWMTLRVEPLSREFAQQLLQASWTDAPKVGKTRPVRGGEAGGR